MPLYREATLEDLPGICVMGEEVNVLHHEAWPDVFVPGGDPGRHSAHWTRSIASENATTYVAEESSGLVGFVTVAVTTDHHSLLQPIPYGRVGSLSVVVEYRGQGIGRALMNQAEAWVLSKGVQDIRLNVWAFNQAALQLYKELGYEIRSQLLGKRLQAGA